ncbi:MAG: class I SAM-dependent methyltransferase [Paraglaciecola sp.]|nr:class I SAM-dependent methyltransferase [Paraglaciecola sp.]NCT47406.1 class I SAM-dependent methyltransferase [Paraglaciecola sp.]
MSTALYTDLSHYYDLMCADIDYQSQSAWVYRLQHIFGNQGRNYLDLACGTAPHLSYFLEKNFECLGLDINQPMLDIAKKRCPDANFMLGNMSDFSLDSGMDLITCFLYSLHYCPSIEALQRCFESVHRALNTGGLFCFNAVDKQTIDNQKVEHHVSHYKDSEFTFTSAWYYSGSDSQQSLRLSIQKTAAEFKQVWQDTHLMVAFTFEELLALLAPYFSVTVFSHDYTKLEPWNGQTGNAIFSCVKK